MMEHNTCKSTQLSLADAERLGLMEGLNIPWAASLTGTYHTPSGLVEIKELTGPVDAKDPEKRKGVLIGSTLFQYEDDLHAAIVSGSSRAELLDEGYSLRWDSGDIWRRRKEDVLCFVSAEVFEGVVPKLERTLKMDRKAAKRAMAKAEEEGDESLRVYYGA